MHGYESHSMNTVNAGTKSSQNGSIADKNVPKPSADSLSLQGTGNISTLDLNSNSLSEETGRDLTTSLNFSDGYGTSFQCTSICHFITYSFLLVILLFLVLLCIIPVSKRKYVKATSRERNPKRTLDTSSTRQQSQLKNSMKTENKSHGNVDVRIDGIDTRDTYEDGVVPTQEEFIESLSENTSHEPLLKFVRTEGAVSPRRQALNNRFTVYQALSTSKPDITNSHSEVSSTSSYENLCNEVIPNHEYMEFINSLMKGIVLKQIKVKNHQVITKKKMLTLSADRTKIQCSPCDGIHIRKKMESVCVGDIARVATKTFPSSKETYLSLIHHDDTSLDIQADSESGHKKLLHGFTTLLKECNLVHDDMDQSLS